MGIDKLFAQYAAQGPRAPSRAITPMKRSYLVAMWKYGVIGRGTYQDLKWEWIFEKQ